jgi:hypothetical protein
MPDLFRHRPITVTREELDGLLSGTSMELRRPVVLRDDIQWSIPRWDLSGPGWDGILGMPTFWVTVRHPQDEDHPNNHTQWRHSAPYTPGWDRLWPRLRGRSRWVDCDGFDFDAWPERGEAASGWVWVLALRPADPELSPERARALARLTAAERFLATVGDDRSAMRAGLERYVAELRAAVPEAPHA